MAKNLADKIPDILLAQLAGFSLVYGLTASLCLTYPPLKILLMVMFCIAILFIFFYNRKTSVASFILLGVSVTASLIYVAFGIGMNKVITFLDGYFYWLGDFIQYPGTPDPVYQLVTVISLCILLSVFTYAFIVKRFVFLVIFAFGMGLFTVQWSYNIVSSLTPFYIFLLVTLVSYLRHIHSQKSAKIPNEYAKGGMMTVWSLPVCVIVIVLAASIHASSKPIEWKWMDKKIVAVYNYFNKKLDYEAFDYFSLSASSGFGDRNNLLGGRVRLDRTNVLQVTTGKNVYLKGVSKDVYTGASWVNSSLVKTPIGNDYSILYNDTAEMLQGMKILTSKNDFVEDYFDLNKITVTFLNLKTKSLFIPSKATVFAPKKGGIIGSIDNTGDLSAARRLTKGFSYSVEMYSPKLGTDEFADVMRQSKRGLYSDYLLKEKFRTYFESILSSNTTIEVRTDPSTSSGSAVIASLISFPTLTSFSAIKAGETAPILTYEDISLLKDNSTKIYEKYLQLPQNLPQRVEDLSASLVASSKNNYDKAKAIEQYLSANYPYNLDVRSTPRNRDFVDYFLFDLKQGYCSYYASAMTVLARCAGLPARYVEGYILPPEPLKNSSTTYIVTNMQAHAWVEIYFEGYGWLPFEPTSPFRANFYASESSAAVFAGSYNSAYNDYMEMMRRYANKGEPFMPMIGNEVQEPTSGSIIIFIAAAIVILLFAVLLLFNMIRGRYKLYRLVNLPAKECILQFYDYYVSVLNLHGLGLEPAETPFQYSGRIDSYLFFSPVKFKVITDIFVRARYSLKEANEKEKQLFCDFHSGFLDEIKNNMGKLKFFTYKYILGKF